MLKGGNPGKTEEETIPGFHPAIAKLPKSEDGKYNIVLQIANFSDPHGGVWDDILLGETKKILDTKKVQFFMDIFLYSTLMIMGVYHLTLYLIRRKDLSPLYFGFFCLLIALRSLLTSERILHVDFPRFDWNILFTLEYLTYYLGVPLFLSFVQSLYPKEFSKKVLRFIQVVSLLFTIIVIFTKVSVFTSLNFYFQIFTLLSILYLVYAIVKAVIKKREDVIFFFLGLISLIVSVVNDLLISAQMYHGIYIFGYGLVSFILFQSILIATRFSRAFAKSEELTLDLLTTNDSISRFVPTEFLNLLDKKNIIDVNLGDQFQKEMTIFFADIRGFTTLSEKLKSEETFQFLNTYFEETISIINTNNGFVDKIIGDGIMAIFPHHPGDAIQASNEISNTIYNWNLEREKNGSFTVLIGIGIHTGNVSIGTVGTRERMDTTVIGDTVNIASRLEGLTKKYFVSVIVSETVFEKLEPDQKKFLRELDNARVRGREKFLTFYENFAFYPQSRIEKMFSIDEDYKNAMELLKSKKYKDAKQIFLKCQKLVPYDPVLVIHINQCSHAIYKENNIKEENLETGFSKKFFILVVEDNPAMKKIFDVSLKKFDCDTAIVSSGEEALFMYKTIFPDLIFIDMNLPGMNGIQTIQSIKRIMHTNKKECPIIVVSADDSQETKQKAQLAGAVEYHEKPITTDIIIRIISRYFKNTT